MLKFASSSLNSNGQQARLLELLRTQALTIGPTVLSTGQESNYYVDAKLVTLSPEGANLTAKVLLAMLKGDQIDALGGPSMGADPILGAVAALSQEEGRPLPTFIVRKEPKKHGKRKLIEGPLKEGSKVAVVDDVVTTGASLLRAIKAVEEMGCQVVRAIALIDRQEGGREALAREGHELVSVFTAEELGVYQARGERPFA